MIKLTDILKEIKINTPLTSDEIFVNTTYSRYGKSKYEGKVIIWDDYEIEETDIDGGGHVNAISLIGYDRNGNEYATTGYITDGDRDTIEIEDENIVPIGEHINEALGVPSNLLDTAATIYNDIISSDFDFIEGDQSDIGRDSEGYNQISGDYKIGEYNYNIVKYFIMVNYSPRANKTELERMAVQSTAKRKGPTKFTNIREEISLIFDFICPDTYNIQQTKKGIRDYLTKNKNKVIASTAHELKHVYDGNKQPNMNLPRVAKYQVATRIIGDRIRPIHDFCFALYYMSVTEALVRPSEVASLIQSGEISKKDFLNFLKSNTTYETLNEIKNMSYEKLRNDLFGYMDYIREVFEDEPELLEGKTDEEIVDMFLTRVRKFLQTGSIDFIENMIFGSSLPSDIPLEFLQMLGFGSKAEFDFMKKTAKQIAKYDDNKSFYGNEIKSNARNAEMIMKKLAKLYDIAK